MRHWSHIESGKLIRRSPSSSLNIANIKSDNILKYGNNQTLQNRHEQPRTLGDFMHPTRTRSSLCIVFSLDASHIHFKSRIIQFLPIFHDFKSGKSILVFKRI